MSGTPDAKADEACAAARLSAAEDDLAKEQTDGALLTPPKGNLHTK